MSRHRSSDPQPLARSSEIATLILAGALTLVTLAALSGLGAAAALFGGGWVWPPDTLHAITAMGGLLSGHLGRGLTATAAARIPGPVAVYGCVALSEILTLTAAVVAVGGITRFQAPGDTRRGMATRAEAAQVLGVRRLRRARAVIRPDLYGPRPSPRNPAPPRRPDGEPR